jgi:predicted RNA-binding Zn ribbon-like protein
MKKRSIETLQLDGGCIVFDFTNTISSRKNESGFDYLSDYSEFLKWSGKVGLLPGNQLKVLKKVEQKSEKLVSKSFRHLIHARDVLYALFSSISNKKPIDQRALKQFNTLLSDSFSDISLQTIRNEFRVSFYNESRLTNEPLNIIMKSAYDVLVNEDSARVKECPSCGWLFLDKTKNGKRKWCDMQVCGSHDKALRYYYKIKEQEI